MAAAAAAAEVALAAAAAKVAMAAAEMAAAVTEAAELVYTAVGEDGRGNMSEDGGKESSMARCSSCSRHAVQ
eukprot:142889-Pleurochrysis_carterae.AAC.1